MPSGHDLRADIRTARAPEVEGIGSKSARVGAARDARGRAQCANIIGPGLASRFHWQWHDPGKKNALNRPYVAVAAYCELVRGIGFEIYRLYYDGNSPMRREFLALDDVDYGVTASENASRTGSTDWAHSRTPTLKGVPRAQPHGPAARRAGGKRGGVPTPTRSRARGLCHVVPIAAG